MEIPDDSQVKDLVKLLDIRDKKLVNVVINGKVKNLFDPIEEGAFVDLFLRFGGG